MKKITALTLVILLLVILSCSQGDKKIILAYKFTPGLSLQYEQVSKSSTKIFRADSLIKNYQTTYTVDITQNIKSVTDNVAEILETDTWYYEKITEEDSTKTDTVNYTREMTILVEPNGRIVDFNYGKDIKPSSASYMKNYHEQGMPVFPSGEHAPGYSWTQQTTVVIPDETMGASTTYKIKSLAREGGYDCAVIEYEGNLVIPIETNPDDSTQRKGIDRVETSGIIYFAYKEGFVVLQRERWVLDGDREKTIEGKIEKTKIASETDIDYTLRSRVIE